MSEEQQPAATEAGSEVDRHFMAAAIAEARQAEAQGDIPIGAVIVHEGRIVARAGNRRRLDQDPVAHAEILVLREAARALGEWRLHGCTIYVSLEPCTMCAGALVLARIDRVVYAAADPKAGAVESLYRVLEDPRLNHRPAITAGVLADEAGSMLRAFFRARRGPKTGDPVSPER